MPEWTQWILIATGIAVGLSLIASWWRDRD